MIRFSLQPEKYNNQYWIVIIGKVWHLAVLKSIMLLISYQLNFPFSLYEIPSKQIPEIDLSIFSERIPNFLSLPGGE